MSQLDRFDAAVMISPLTTLVRGVIEWVFPPGSWTQLQAETAPECQPRKLSVDAVCWLMVQVVAGAKRSVFAAFEADQAAQTPTLTASYQAVYSKLERMSPQFSCELVRVSAERLAPLLKEAGYVGLTGWKNYRVRMIDGTQPDGSEHRLKELRKTRAAGLPCRAVVLFDPAAGLCADVAASEDAYASEQTLAESLLERIVADDLIVGDRHFAVSKLMLPLDDRGARFIVREHPPQIVLNELGKARRIGKVETGIVWEQPVEVVHTATDRSLSLRRIIVRLSEPTEKGDTEVRLLTNLPACENAPEIARLYRQRWSVEEHFHLVKNYLQGQIPSLGKPRAAIFVLCMALVAANTLGMVTQAIATVQGQEEAERLSGYYLADEIAGHYRAIDKLLPPCEWETLLKGTTKQFWSWSRHVTQDIRLRAFYTHPRGPKKPPPPRASGKNRHHYSTQRLIDEHKNPC